jgi:hypothetical protein
MGRAIDEVAVVYAEMDRIVELAGRLEGFKLAPS